MVVTSKHVTTLWFLQIEGWGGGAGGGGGALLAQLVNYFLCEN